MLKGRKACGRHAQACVQPRSHCASFQPNSSNLVDPQSREAPLGQNPPPHLTEADSSFSSTLLTPPTIVEHLSTPSLARAHTCSALLRSILRQRPQQLPKSGKDTCQSILPLSSKVSWQLLWYLGSPRGQYVQGNPGLFSPYAPR